MKIKHNVTFKILYTQPMVRSRYQRLLTIMRVLFKINTIFFKMALCYLSGIKYIFIFRKKTLRQRAFAKYSNFSDNYIFLPVGVETYGAYVPNGIKLVKQTGNKNSGGYRWKVVYFFSIPKYFNGNTTRLGGEAKNAPKTSDVICACSLMAKQGNWNLFSHMFLVNQSQSLTLNQGLW